MDKVSERLQKLEVSQTIAMSQRSRDLKCQGVKVIDLSVGEPDFQTPDFVKEAAKQAIDDNITFYSPVPGFPDLLKAICDKFSKENGLEYSPNQVVVSNGAKQSLANIILALVDKDDEVIIPAPYWVSYAELVKIAEGKSVIINTRLEDDFKMTPAQLDEAITPKTRVLILCSPSNPTGTVYSKEELVQFAEVLERHPNVFVISDEIYEHINYIGKHQSIAQFPSIYSRVMVVNGVSKGYAMTGWRIGYCAGPSWLAKACVKLQGQTTTGANSIAQKAATAALNSDGSYPKMMRKAFLGRRDLMIEGMNHIPGFKANVPQGAFYIFPDISHYFGTSNGAVVISDSTDFAMYLLEKAHVAVVPGIAFGAPNCIRLSYAASSSELVDALSRIATAVKLLKRE
jgi:aspartate aminotransferase